MTGWRLTRRQFLLAAGGVAVTACGADSGCAYTGPLSDFGARDPWSPDSGPPVDATPPPRFFTDAERATLAAAAALILPDGQGLGATENGAVDYVERLLTAFETDPPGIFAGGPFSGRHPVAGDGTHDDFAEFLPLTRAQTLAFRAELYGTAAVPELAANDARLGPHPGLRNVYRDGIARLNTEAGAGGFAALPADQREAILDRLDAARERDRRTGRNFVETLVGHVCEAVFGDPVYGGNRQAWQALAFDGDSQPLGFSQWNGTEWVERPEAPLSGPDPGDVDAQGHVTAPDFDADTVGFLHSLILPRRFDP